MKRIFSFLASLVILNSWASIAHASGPDSSTFLLNPSTVLTTSQWPTAYDNIAILPINVYWNFNGNGTLNPSGTPAVFSNSSNPDATYYGVNESTRYSLDSFISNGVTWNSTGANAGTIGVSGNKTSGTATFNFNTTGLANSSDNNMIYIWAEVAVTTGSSTFVDFSALTGGTVTASELFNESTGKEIGTSALNNNMQTGIYDAYFAVSQPTSTESLQIGFNDPTGSGGQSALLDSLHIAVTPEPMAMALFATGGLALLFFNRRRLGFYQLA